MLLWRSAEGDRRGKKGPRIALPSRWTWSQRLKNTSLYLIICLTAWAIRRVPFQLFRPVSQILGSLTYWIAAKDRRRAVNQLLQTGLAKTPQRARLYARAMFVHFAQSVLELGQAKKLLRRPEYVQGESAARKIFDDALQEGRGLIAVTGHIGNWELCAQQFGRWGYPVCAIAKPLYDPRLSALIEKERRDAGLTTIWRGDRDAARGMLQVFRSQGMLCLLIDQDTHVSGTFVSFFGRAAHTSTAPAILALKRRIPLVVGWMHRVGRQHHMTVRRICTEGMSLCPEDITQLTQRLSDELEFAIRAQPAQWVWLHRRWKQQPSSE